MASPGNATHAEIWDDSTLVNSWNEALQEYERYHSIHARGEKVEDVLKDFDEQEKNELEPIELESNENEMVVEEAIDEETIQRGSCQAEDNADVVENEPQVDNQPTVEAIASQTTESKAPALPPMLVGQVHDEGLRNLLMSWYYAGYYTGLYEGQQQKQGQASDN